MIITKYSDLLYDTKNFNKYNNIYAVLIQQKYYDKVNQSYNDQKLYIKYDKDTNGLELYYLLDSCIYMINKMHDIIYGHFYNKHDLFLYKKFANNKLVEYNLVTELGRLDAPGRPLLFGTTEEFLRRFGIESIEELPEINSDKEEEFKEEALEEAKVKLNT